MTRLDINAPSPTESIVGVEDVFLINREELSDYLIEMLSIAPRTDNAQGVRFMVDALLATINGHPTSAARAVERARWFAYINHMDKLVIKPPKLTGREQ